MTNEEINAERIVACVNFCAGLDEIDLGNPLGASRLIEGLTARIDDLSHQRAVLAARIKELELPWISVAERLPKKSGSYMVWYRFNDAHAWQIYYDSKNDKWWSQGMERKPDLWQTLPNPPKSRENL